MALTKIERDMPDGKRIYRVWKNMRRRCYSTSDEHYKNYGERGIKVCDEWHDPWTFYYWAINNGYREGLTIDRIDVNGDYCPENCRWTTNKEQQNNRTNNRLETINGITKTCAEWCKEHNVSPGTVDLRMKRKGISFEEALNMPTQHKTGKLETIDGITKNRKEWCEEYHVHKDTVSLRMKKFGISFEQALKMPNRYIVTE